MPSESVIHGTVLLFKILDLAVKNVMNITLSGWIMADLFVLNFSNDINTGL